MGLGFACLFVSGPWGILIIGTDLVVDQYFGGWNKVLGLDFEKGNGYLKIPLFETRGTMTNPLDNNKTTIYQTF